MTQHEPSAAIEQLRDHQRQLDEHGEFVGVSRQALDEVLDYIAAARVIDAYLPKDGDVQDCLEQLNLTAAQCTAVLGLIARQAALSATLDPLAMARAMQERCAAVADEWRDENKESASKARKRRDHDLAAQLTGAATECNAIAQVIRSIDPTKLEAE